MTGAPGLARRTVAALAAAALMLASCGGGGGAANQAATNPTTPVATAVYAVPAQEALTVADVGQILAQAIAEAQARNLPSFITVTDRVGNVLANYKMTFAPVFTHIDGNYVAVDSSGANPRLVSTPIANKHDFQGLDVPSAAASIAMAVTASYLSSGGNAFTTRTASEIVQEHFPPANNTAGLESGPLFGVQFSSLPCSDLSPRYSATGGAAAAIGPKRSPLGLSADPGGIPLYKNGVLVGGIGVEGDGAYRRRSPTSSTPTATRRSSSRSPAPPASRRVRASPPTRSPSTAPRCAIPTRHRRDCFRIPAPRRRSRRSIRRSAR